jgi:hypothetical protein
MCSARLARCHQQRAKWIFVVDAVQVRDRQEQAASQDPGGLPRPSVERWRWTGGLSGPVRLPEYCACEHRTDPNTDVESVAICGSLTTRGMCWRAASALVNLGRWNRAVADDKSGFSGAVMVEAAEIVSIYRPLAVACSFRRVVATCSWHHGRIANLSGRPYRDWRVACDSLFFPTFTAT